MDAKDALYAVLLVICCGKVSACEGVQTVSQVVAYFMQHCTLLWCVPEHKRSACLFFDLCQMNSQDNTFISHRSMAVSSLLCSKRDN